MIEIEDVFHEVAALLLIAAAVGALAMRLRQPLIISFIAVGILVGPSVLGIVSARDQIELLAELGIALLLFVVGLRLDLHLIRTLGPVALAAGISQVAVSSAAGFAVALLLGLGIATASYVAIALAFSSTVIVVKLLSDRRETDALHGRIAVGVLIVQDILVVATMIALTAIGAGEERGNLGLEVAEVIGKGAVFLGVIALFTRFALTPLVHRLAHTPELLVLFAIAWAVSLGAAGDLLGFSKEVGAFLGGVSLASTPYREAIGARLVSLRDFLILFFFIDLGARLDLADLGEQIPAALLLSALVLFGKPLAMMAITGAMGYSRRVSFLTGVHLAQVSEFSLILGALGLTLGHIDNEAMALITAVALITIAASTYMILYSHELFERAAPWLSVFERGEAARRPEPPGPEPVDVLVLGIGRYGGAIAQALQDEGLRVMGVDYDPRKIRERHAEGLPAVYGDAEDPELPSVLPLAQTDRVISTIPRRDAGLAVLHALRHHGFRGKIAVTAHDPDDAEALRKAGADTVLTPFEDAAIAVEKLVSNERPTAT